jgi:broad specificity phosphatase PhoE
MQDNNVGTVLMIRHTDVHNPSNIIYGRLPRFGLSTLGLNQAKSVADLLEGWPVAALYSSPQLRARQTAAIINQALHIDRIHISRRISEVLTGYEGQSNSILGGKFNFYDDLARTEDESITMIWSRMATFLDVIARRHPGQTVAAISHADPIMILRAGILGRPLVIESLQGQYYPLKGSITEFSYVGESRRPLVVYHTPAEGSHTATANRDTSAQSPDSVDAHNGHHSRSGAATPWIPSH